MKRLLLVLLVTITASAQVPVERIVNDAITIDRVAELSRRDFPGDLLKRLVEEDIDMLRGRRADGSYEYASYERFEAGRVTNDWSVQPREDKMQTLESRGDNIYRVIIEVPNRRMLVRRNRPVWVERVDVTYVAQGSTQSRQESFEVKTWLQPGDVRPIELPDIARQATVNTIVTAEKGGYSNVEVALAQARIVDSAVSPYADAVNAAKAALRAIEGRDIEALRSAAMRMRNGVGGRESASSIAVVAPPVPTIAQPADSASRVEMQAELQMIEDLLTGTESERRDGLDRLHQLIRRLR